MIQLFDLSDLVKCIFGRKFWLSLVGYRPEVICIANNSLETDKYLMIVPQGDHKCWLFPQEGIKANESVVEAAERCLRVELGLTENQIQLRKSVWVGKRILPKERRGERDLRFPLRCLFGKAGMIGKAYFAALLLVDPKASIRPNLAEVYRWEWVSAQEVKKRIRTNSSDKILILEKAWRKLVEK